MADFSQADWEGIRGSIGGDGISFTENFDVGVHAITQDIQELVDVFQLGTSAVLQARVEAVDRPIVTLSCREDSGVNTAWFQLTGAGVLLTKGVGIATATIAQVAGTNQYDLTIIFSGNLPQSLLRFSVGASTGDSPIQNYQGDGQTCFRIYRAQITKGTTPVAYQSTDNRLTIYDGAVSDGSQDASLPATAANRPNDTNIDYLIAGNDPVTINDFAYSADKFTASVVVAHDGSTGSDQIFAEHNGPGQLSWQMGADTDAKFFVKLSTDGSTLEKHYVADRFLETLVRTKCTFTYNEGVLRMYYNDVELTGVELIQTIDDSISGSLHNSTSDVNLIEDADASRLYNFRLYSGAATPAEVAAIAAEFGVSGLPDQGNPPGGDGGDGGDGGSPGGGGNVPATRAEMETYLTNTFGVSQFFYVNNLSGNDSNPGSLAQPWATIQKAADTLTSGQAVIIQGEGGRFYEQITPGNSGISGARIYYAGDPEHPAIIDGTESFNQTWTNMGGNRWRAPYSQTRAWWYDTNYANFGGSEIAYDPAYHNSHGLVYNDNILQWANHVGQFNSSSLPAPPSLNEGEFYYEGDHRTPTFMWCRLPGDVDPNGVSLRILSDKKYLFDWSSTFWVEGYFGRYVNRDDPAEKYNSAADGTRLGRSYIGLLNLHFTGCSTIIKRGMVNLRGTDNWVEWCSFRNSKHRGLCAFGGGHTVINCKFDRNGQGSFGGDYLNFWEDARGNTLFKNLYCTNGNWQRCAVYWDAGNKFTNSFRYDVVTFEECYFNEYGPGYWADIDTGNLNGGTEAVVFERCIWSECAGMACFLENGTRKHFVRNSAIWNTQLAPERTHFFAAGFRCQGAGNNTITNCASIYNRGKGHYFKAHDLRDVVNNDVITNNVYTQNARDTNAFIYRAEFGGGNSGISGQEWRDSDIDNNVFGPTLGTSLFNRDQQGSTYTPSSDLGTFQSFDWTNGSGNVIDGSAGNVVEDHTDRKLFFVTNHSGGLYPTKGPQGLVHPDDISNMQWTVPT